jgi:hypothetical protein
VAIPNFSGGGGLALPGTDLKSHGLSITTMSSSEYRIRMAKCAGMQDRGDVMPLETLCEMVGYYDVKNTNVSVSAPLALGGNYTVIDNYRLLFITDIDISMAHLHSSLLRRP